MDHSTYADGIILDYLAKVSGYYHAEKSVEPLS